MALSVRKLAARERHSEAVRVSSSTTSGVRDNGLDAHNPTTGKIRSSSTDDIACCFIDTDCSEESFFVRHAYLTGVDQPYKKLQGALKAEINEDAWSTLCSTVSRPFDAPSTGKIAVKVINHYGDEVLKVYGCASNPPA